MTNCHVSNQIAIKADEPEQESAWEKYQYLEKNGFVNINGKSYDDNDVFSLIDFGEIKYVTKNQLAKMYIDKIAELMDD